MKILIITPVKPYPLNSGGSQAVFNMIDNLRDKVDFSILCFYSGSSLDREALCKLKYLWPNVNIYNYSYVKRLKNKIFLWKKVRRFFNKLFRSNSLSFIKSTILDDYGYEFDETFFQFMTDIIERDRIELVQTEFYPMLSLVFALPISVKKIFIQHEIHFVRNELALRSFYPLNKFDEFKFRRSRAYEIAMMNQYDSIITLTDVDNLKIKNAGVCKHIYVSPAAVADVRREQSVSSFNNVVAFIGGYSHVPNKEGLTWFIDHVWPIVNKKNPSLSLSIIGGGWPSCYNNKARRICVKGYVDDLEIELKGAILVVPILTGSGMRMKILDGVKYNCPFITTSVGVEGLNFVDGVHCFIADSADVFADKVLLLSDSLQLRTNFISSACTVYNKELSTEVLVNRRFEIYRKVLKK